MLLVSGFQSRDAPVAPLAGRGSHKHLSEVSRHQILKQSMISSLCPQGYIRLYRDKTAEVQELVHKLTVGLDKLVETRAQVEVMGTELEVKKEVVAKKQIECQDLLVVILEKRSVADEQKKQVRMGDPARAAGRSRQLLSHTVVTYSPSKRTGCHKHFWSLGCLWAGL